MIDNGARLPIIESLILSSPEPLPSRKIADIVEGVTVRDVDEAVELLNRKYLDSDLSFRIRKIAGGYQVYIIEDYARYVEELLSHRRNIRLTRAALETLAIIAYRQPVTKIDVESIRGVASDSVIHTLLERKLVTLAGRSETVGRPLLYKTADEFLKFFNLASLEDLPRMEEIEELLASRDSDTQQRLPLIAQNIGLPSRDPVEADPEDTVESSEGEPVDAVNGTGDSDFIPLDQPTEETADVSNDRECLDEVESVEKTGF